MADHITPDTLNTWKGRDSRHAPQGSNARAATITEEQVLEIKGRIVAGETLVRIARDYPITSRQIGRIKSGEAWRHVPWPTT